MNCRMLWFQNLFQLWQKWSIPQEVFIGFLYLQMIPEICEQWFCHPGPCIWPFSQISLIYMAHRLYHHYPQFSSGPSKHGHMVHSLRTNIQPTWASACPLVLKESLRDISCAWDIDYCGGRRSGTFAKGLHFWKSLYIALIGVWVQNHFSIDKGIQRARKI